MKQRCRKIVAGQRAMTLVELLMALSITGLVGVAVATMMAGVSYGTTSKKELGAVVVKLKAVTGRLDAALRSGAMILEVGTNYLVVWNGDANGDEAANISEIRLIERDAATGRLTSYSANFGSMTEAQIEAVDTGYALNSNFRTVTTSLKSGQYFPGTRWADEVTAWSVTPDQADEQAARVASYRITITSGTVSETEIGAAALRNIDAAGGGSDEDD
jgi:prepilin-type N-terminal cleavage/methylation domain-containing protein